MSDGRESGQVIARPPSLAAYFCLQGLRVCENYGNYPLGGGVILLGKETCIVDNTDSAVQVASLYSLGREHARLWMDNHPDASKEELIEHLSQFRASWPISTSLFDEMVRGITCRVFFMRSLNKHAMP